MWGSAAEVEKLKASLRDPNVKFVPRVQPKDVRVFHGGKEVNDTESSKNLPAITEQQSAGETLPSKKISTSTHPKIVLDAGAFITGANLTNFGQDTEYYTIQEVIDELKDADTRDRFEAFPFPIKVKEVFHESMAYINKMSRLTGDYYVLSDTDRKILALVYQLETETHGETNIRHEVAKPITIDLKDRSSSGKTSGKKASNGRNKRIRPIPPAQAQTQPQDGSSSSPASPAPDVEGTGEETLQENDENTGNTTQTSEPTEASSPSSPSSSTPSRKTPSKKAGGSSSHQRAQPVAPCTWASTTPLTVFDLDTFLQPLEPVVDSVSTVLHHQQRSKSVQTKNNTTSTITTTTQLTCDPQRVQFHALHYLGQSITVQYHQDSSSSLTASSGKTQRSSKHKSRFIVPGFDDSTWLTPANITTLAASSTNTKALSNAVSAAKPTTTTTLVGIPIVETEQQQQQQQQQNSNQEQDESSSGEQAPPQSDDNHDHSHTIKTNEDGEVLPVFTADASIQSSVQSSSDTSFNHHQVDDHTTSSLFTATSSVGCITTDYSMQNVLLQCGMRCITVGGYAVSSIRQYIMGCHACYTLSKDMSRGFCPSCGNYTMVRLTIHVNKNGKVNYSWPLHQIYNTRGTRYAIPTIKGGKHNKDLILREDMMPKPKLRDIKIARGEITDSNTSSKDLYENAALFAFQPNIVQQTAKFGYGRRNVNEVRHHKKKR